MSALATSFDIRFTDGTTMRFTTWSTSCSTVFAKSEVCWLRYHEYGRCR